MVSCPRSCRLAAVLVCLFLFGVTQLARATASLLFDGLVRTLNTGGSITLSSPAAIVVDPAGNVYIADTSNNRIVEVNAQGTASVLTITGLSPSLSSPSGLAIDGAGNLYIADTGNSRVVKVSSSGAGSVIATGSVTLSAPKGVALDQSGDILISDTGNNQIVEVTSGGAAAALSITVSSGSSSLNAPRGPSVDPSGNIFIADTGNNRVVKVAAGSTTGVLVSIGELMPALSSPSSVVVDRVGNVFIADTGNNRIVEVDTAISGDLLLNTVFLQGTTLSGPLGVALDVFGEVFVADTGDSRALIVDPYLNGDPGTGAGYTSSLNKTAVGFGHITLGSSTPTSLVLNFAVGSPVSGLGGVNVFTSGTMGLDFQIVGGGTTCSGSTLSGSGCTVEVSFLPTAPGLRDGAVVLYDPSLNPVLTLPLYGIGDAPVAALAPNTGTVVSTGGVALNFPFQIALDGVGTIYDANDGGNLVKIPAGGGSASVVSPGGLTFGSEVTGVAVDGAGNLFISDHTNNRIIVITPGNVASVLSIAGLGTALNHPTGLALDGAGNLYISDWVNGRVVEVSSLFVAGSTSKGIGTVIGTGSYIASAEGITGVAVDSLGNIYIPDGYAGSDPSRIIKVTAAGMVSLLTPAGITFSQPRGVSVDGMGNIYVNDGGHNRIVEMTTAGVASVLAISGLPNPTTLGSPFGVTVDPSGNLYIPDSGNNRVLFVNVSGAALTFPTTATGATSAAKTATVTNLGNQALVFSTNPTYTANFSNNSSDINPCTSSTSLSAGLNCDVSVQFTPQSVGSLSAGITVTNNTLNVAGSTQQVSVSGTSFSPIQSTTTTVTFSPPSPVYGQPVTLTASVSVSVDPTPTGTVTFTDVTTSTTLASNVTLSSGVATFSLSTLGAGSHTIHGVYTPTGNFSTSSGSVALSIAKAATSTAVTLSGGTLTAAVTVIAPGAGTPTGTVQFLNGSTPLGSPVPLSGGTAALMVTVPSTYTFTAVYSGDNNFTGSTSAAVSKTTLPTTTAVTFSPSFPTDGQAVTVIATVSATGATPTGTVTFTDLTTSATLASNVNLSTGVASVTLTTLGVGSHTIQAVYTPTGSFLTSSGSNAVSVKAPATSSLSLTSSVNPSVLGQAVTFTAVVTTSGGSATGTVQFSDGAKVLGNASVSNGQAVFTTSALTGGTHDIIARYSGDSTFPPGQAAYGQIVNATVTMTVSVVPAAPIVGQTIVFTVSVSAAVPAGFAAPTGQVTLAEFTGFSSGTPIGTASLSSGTATLSLSSLAPGTHTLRVQYSGDATWNGAAQTVTVTVSRASSSSTISLATVSGQLTLTANVAAVTPGTGTPTGSVQFVDAVKNTTVATATLSGGMASATVAASAVASVEGRPIQAVYSGDANFNGSASAPLPAILNAAWNFSGSFAPDEIASLYGITGLNGDTTASFPLTTSLGGVTVTITDSTGTGHPALLYGVYASADQINLLVPSGTATGPAVVTITLPGGGTISTVINIVGTAPGIFTTNMTGQGVYAGQVVYVHQDGTQTMASSTEPINLSVPGGQVYLVLYGTGLRHAGSVTAAVNGASVPVVYFGAQGGSSQSTSNGLDQVNVGPLPTSLEGAGTVSLVISADGQAANTVTFTVQ